jgi:8-oxo-dGTP pyrophosphatase MutT (NUDIX family)
MKAMINLLAAIGKLAYLVSLPVIRLYLKRTKRAYVLIRYKDEVLVVKNLLSRGSWMLPGGGIKSYESPKLGAIREAWEEIKTSGKWDTDNLGHFYIIFEIRLSQKPKNLNLRQPELLTARWLPPAEIRKNTTVEIHSALKS